MNTRDDGSGYTHSDAKQNFMRARFPCGLHNAAIIAVGNKRTIGHTGCKAIEHAAMQPVTMPVSRLFRAMGMLVVLAMCLLLAGCGDDKPKIQHSETPRYNPVSSPKMAEFKKQGYEVPPAFKASEILPPELVRGDHHVLDETVYNDGIINHYRINSRFGVYDVASSQMLMIRVSEVEIMGELHEMSRAEVIVGALGKQAKGILLSPVNTVKRLFSIVSRPKDTAQSVAAVPGGVARFVESAKGRSKDAYKSMTSHSDSLEDVVNTQPVHGAFNQPAPRRPEKDNVVEKFVKDRIGLNKRLREWQQKLGIDPYSSNLQLHEELKRIVNLETAVGVAFDFVPIGLKIPGMGIVSDVNKYHGTVMKVAKFKDPRQLAKRNREALLDMGADEESLKRFYGNVWYTPVTRTMIVDALLEMEGVANRGSYIKMAARANSEASALFFARSLRELADMHADKGYRMTEIMTGVHMPAAVTENKQIIIPLAVVDHMCWTKHVAALFDGLIRQKRKKYSMAAVVLMVNGTLSGRTKKELKDRGIQFHEKVAFESSDYINPSISLLGVKRVSSAPVTVDRIKEVNQRYAPTSIDWQRTTAHQREVPENASW